MENKDIQNIVYKNNIAGFWRRAVAFVIDLLLLALLCYVCGFVFISYLAKIGLFLNHAIGYLIALLYFGVLESGVGGGKTIGKKILKIKVVQANYAFLSLKRSLLRAALFWAPSLLNGVFLPLNIPKLVGITYLIVSIGIIFVLGGAQFYFYIFNQKTRQAVHDLVVGSYVINDKCDRNIALPKIWVGHFIIYPAILCLLTISISVAGLIEWHNIAGPLASLNKDQDELQLISDKIQKLPGVNIVNVSAGISYNSKEKMQHKVLAINIVKNSALVESQKDVLNIIQLVLDNYKNINSYDYIFIKEGYGFDLIFASFYFWSKFTKTVKEWQNEVFKNDSPWIHENKEKFSQRFLRQF